MEEENMFDGFDISNLIDTDTIEVDTNQPTEEEVVPENTTKTEDTKPKETSVEEDTIDLDEFKNQPNVENTSEEEEQSSEDDIPSTSPEEETPSPSSSPYLAFAKVASEGGVFNEFSDEEWSSLVEETGSEIDAIIELQNRVIEDEVSKREKTFTESLSEEDRAIFHAKKKGLPLDEYGEVQSAKKEYGSITDENLETDESLQEQIIRKDLELRGFSSEEIDDEIEVLKDTDRLYKRSKPALGKINKHYKAKEAQLHDKQEQQKQAIIKQREEQLNQVTQAVENTQEIVPGLKLNKKSRERLMESMTTPVAKDPNGNLLNAVMATRAKNPTAFEMALHYYNDIGLFNVDDKGVFKPDFSKIMTKATSDASKNFRKTVESNDVFKGGDSSIKPKTSKDKDYLKTIEEGFKNFDQLYKR